MGETLIRSGATIAIVVFFGGRWMLSTLASMGVPLGSPTLVSRGVVVAALATALAGAWLVATPDPGEAEEPDRVPTFQRRSVLRAALIAVAALLVVRIGLDPVLPVLAGPLLSLTMLALGLTALRGVGGVVRRLLQRCSDVSEKDAERAGQGGAWIFWVIVAIAMLTALPSLFGGGAAWGTLVTASARLERLILSFGSIAVALCLFSIAKPMKAIRSEKERGERDKPKGRGPDPEP